MLATAHLDGQTGKRVHSKAPGKVCNLKAGTGNCSYMWLLPESQALGGSNGLRVRPQAGSTGEALRDPKQSSDRACLGRLECTSCLQEPCGVFLEESASARDTERSAVPSR